MAISTPLGSGVHGSVFSAEDQSGKIRCAIKVHEHERYYCRERDVYLRLKERGVHTIHGCSIPDLLEYDSDLWILEMTVVTRPFILDFAGAYLDQPPDFSEEVIADWRTEKMEQFGSHWNDVLRILGFLEAYGIFMVDVNPGNISFEDSV